MAGPANALLGGAPGTAVTCWLELCHDGQTPEGELGQGSASSSNPFGVVVRLGRINSRAGICYDNVERVE